MKIPIILLVFANDTSNFLPSLQKELTQIEQNLAQLHINGELITVKLENATADGLFQRLSMIQKSQNPIRILHFSGHAGGTKLLLEDGLIDATGLTRFLALFKDEIGNNPLKLVFLNGCATVAQVQLLHDKGIPAVIATQQKISDLLATTFATKFYQYFLQDAHNLETAFEMAAAETEATTQQPINLYRGAKMTETDDFAWGLYVNPKYENIRKWRFSLSTVPETTDIPEVNGGVNRIFEALKQHGATVLVKDKGQMQLSFEDKQEMLIEEFSWLIGVPLRRLFTEDLANYDYQRLIRLIDTYTFSMRFVAFILLSQVMDNKKLREDERLKEIFPISPEKHRQYDFLKLQKICYDLLAENGNKLFVKEIAQYLENVTEDKEIANMFTFMEDIRRVVLMPTIVEKWTAEEFEMYAKKTESILTEVLIQFSFLAKYKLLTVTDIEIHRLRFQAETKFEHFYGELHGLYESFEGFMRGQMTDYAYSHSVLLVQKGSEDKLDNPQNYLVLSPLIFDNNAYTDLKIQEYRSKTPNIYFYLYTDETETRKHVYLDINYDSLAPQDNAFKRIYRGNNEQPKLDKVYEQMKTLVK